MAWKALRPPPSLLQIVVRFFTFILSAAFTFHAADEVQQGLAAQHVNTSVSRIGSSRWDFAARQLAEVVRASVHYFNTEGEVQRCVEAVRHLAATGKGGRLEAAALLIRWADQSSLLDRCRHADYLTPGL